MRNGERLFDGQAQFDEHLAGQADDGDVGADRHHGHVDRQRLADAGQRTAESPRDVVGGLRMRLA